MTKRKFKKLAQEYHEYFGDTVLDIVYHIPADKMIEAYVVLIESRTHEKFYVLDSVNYLPNGRTYIYEEDYDQYGNDYHRMVSLWLSNEDE